MKINICMLLGLRYGEKMRIAPQIGIASYITNFGHDVTWVLSSEEIKEVQETTFNDVRVFVVPCRYSEGLLKVLTKILYALRRMRFLFNNFKKEKYNMIFVRDSIIDLISDCFRNFQNLYKDIFSWFEGHIINLSKTALDQLIKEYKMEEDNSID